MPFMDGYESTTLIREFLYAKNLPQPIITGITGHIESQYVKRCFNSGMNQVLSKPVDNDLLEKTVRKVGYI